MSLVELVLIALSLSMDAFAVSICKGLSLKKVSLKQMAWIGLWFGGFQALMPLIGYMAASFASGWVQSFDHWIAFILLALIGGKMIWDSFHDEKSVNASLSVGSMFVLAIATSIDALAIGVTFAFMKVNVLLAITLIGLITFALSAIGVKIGTAFGSKYQSKATLAGGIILVLIGVKILMEGLL